MSDDVKSLFRRAYSVLEDAEFCHRYTAKFRQTSLPHQNICQPMATLLIRGFLAPVLEHAEKFATVYARKNMLKKCYEKACSTFEAEKRAIEAKQGAKKKSSSVSFVNKLIKNGVRTKNVQIIFSAHSNVT